MQCCVCSKPCSGGIALVRTFVEFNDDKFQLTAAHDIDDDGLDSDADYVHAMGAIPTHVIAQVAATDTDFARSLREFKPLKAHSPWSTALRDGDQGVYVYCHQEHLCIRGRRATGQDFTGGTPLPQPAAT